MTSYCVGKAAQAICERARARMLVALLGGQPLPARALAHAAGVSEQAASAHLAKLVDAGLVEAERRGRQRYYRLSGAHVTAAVEALAKLDPHPRAPADDPLHEARTCYDHLGGAIAVALNDAFLAQRWLTADYELTFIGSREFRRFGISILGLRAARRAFARGCPDWSEPRHHLAGALGAALMRRLLERAWLERVGGRGVRLTDEGREGLAATFGVRL